MTILGILLLILLGIIVGGFLVFIIFISLLSPGNKGLDGFIKDLFGH